MPELPLPEDLVRRLREGNPEAAESVVREFTGRLTGLARQRFDEAFRRKEDPEDVVQSAFKSFFRGYHEGRLDPQDSEELWGLLALITLRKCRQRRRYFGAARRQLRRESQPVSNELGPFDHVAGREPAPDDATLIAETVEQLLAELDAGHRAILALGLQGYTSTEIAASVGITERTVQRVLRRARQKLEKWAKSEPDDVSAS